LKKKPFPPQQQEQPGVRAKMDLNSHQPSFLIGLAFLIRYCEYSIHPIYPKQLRRIVFPDNCFHSLAVVLQA